MRPAPTVRPAQASPEPDCECGYDGDWRACIDGAVYGPCEDEHCGGICEYEGTCDCACHKPATN